MNTSPQNQASGCLHSLELWLHFPNAMWCSATATRDAMGWLVWRHISNISQLEALKDYPVRGQQQSSKTFSRNRRLQAESQDKLYQVSSVLWALSCKVSSARAVLMVQVFWREDALHSPAASPMIWSGYQAHQGADVSHQLLPSTDNPCPVIITLRFLVLFSNYLLLGEVLQCQRWYFTN